MMHYMVMALSDGPVKNDLDKVQATLFDHIVFFFLNLWLPSK